MLTLNQEVYVIVDQNGLVEYGCDGPLLEYSEDGEVEYLDDCLIHLKQTNSEKKCRIVKVKLTEIP